MADFSELKGQTVVEVLFDSGSEDWRGSEGLEFITKEGNHYRMYHSQDCCESVYIDDIVGEMRDIIGWTVMEAEERTNSTDPIPEGEYEDSYTWTYYTIRTFMHTVTIKWYGSSNGYYSESVDFVKI